MNRWLSTLWTTTLTLGGSLYAQPTEPTLFHPTGEKKTVFIPFVFSTDATGTAGGVATIIQGILQPQTTLIAALTGGGEQVLRIGDQRYTERFKGAMVLLNNYRLPLTKRAYLRAYGIYSYFPKAVYYFHGTNDSSQSDGVVASGYNNFAAMTLSYVLPWQDGKSSPLPTRPKRYEGTLDGHGIAVAGVQYFYQYNSFEHTQPSHRLDDWACNGLRFFINYDHTDYDVDPSRGYQVKLRYSRDFGWGDSLQSWDFLEVQYNDYLPLPSFSWAKRSVLATSFWTGYGFSWDTKAPTTVAGVDAHRPPMWEGARLGGMFRMRAYDTNRFSDRAVVYATAEYRTTLRWNPFKHIDAMPVAIDWIQLVGFVEAGRVNETYNLDLLKDLKYDAGVSLRLMAAQVPVRFDVAFGEEGTNIWAMVYHPFDF